MPLRFLQPFLLLYMEKGETGRYLRNNTKNTKAHTTQRQAACRALEVSCSFLIRMRQLWSTLVLLVPRSTGLD